MVPELTLQAVLQAASFVDVTEESQDNLKVLRKWSTLKKGTLNNTIQCD